MKKIYLENFILEILQKNSGSIVLMLYTNILENDRLFLEYSCIFFFRNCEMFWQINWQFSSDSHKYDAAGETEW